MRPQRGRGRVPGSEAAQLSSRCTAGSPLASHGAARRGRGPRGTGLGTARGAAQHLGLQWHRQRLREPGGRVGRAGRAEEPPESAARHPAPLARPGRAWAGRLHVPAAHPRAGAPRRAVRAGLLRRSPRQGSPSGGGAAGPGRRVRPSGSARGPGRAGPTRGGGSTRPAGKAPSRRRSQPGAGPGAGSCSTPGLAQAPPAALGTERTGRVGHFAGNFSLFPYFLPARGQVQQLLGLPPRGFRPEWESPALGFLGESPHSPPIPILPGGGPSFPTSCCRPEGSARAHS